MDPESRKEELIRHYFKTGELDYVEKFKHAMDFTELDLSDMIKECRRCPITEVKIG